MDKIKIELGDEVRDKISGYVGIVVAKTEFLNGCIQYTVVRKIKKGQDLPLDTPCIDEVCLEVIKKRVIKTKRQKEEIDDKEDEKEDEEETKGGAVTFNKGMRGY